MKKIIVLSGKGGVGKTTITALIAKNLNKEYRIGLIDADLHCPNLPVVLGIEKKDLKVNNEKRIIPLKMNDEPWMGIISSYFLMNDEALIWRGPLKHKLLLDFKNAAWPELDYMIIDSPPGTGDEVISSVQLFQPDIAIIVLTPQKLSIMDAERAINFAEKMGIKDIRIIVNMSDLASIDKVKGFKPIARIPIIKELTKSPVLPNNLEIEIDL
ncbi:ATP-binding protein [Candidatus Woesearchaeota archaeon]|nr:ATP-binding protein [Candidatus Woesearchaeota archaeon]